MASKKSNDVVSATDFCMPNPGVPPLKNQVDLRENKAPYSNVDPVKGSMMDSRAPVSSKPSSPIKGEGFSDGEFVPRGSGRRGSVTYGKG